MQLRNYFLSYFVFLAFLISPSTSYAEKVNLITSHSVGAYGEIIQGFKLKATFAYTLIDLSGNPEKGRMVMQQFSPSNTSLVIALGELASNSLTELSPSVPVVYSMVFDPIHPEKPTYSGVILKIDIKTRLSKIHQLFPSAKNIGMVFNSTFSNKEIAEARNIAPSLNLDIFALPVDNGSEMTMALKKFTRNTVDVIMLVPDITIANTAALQTIMTHSQKESIPCVGLSTYHMKAGTVAALVVDFKDIGAQTAELAQKCLETPTINHQVILPRKVIVYVNTRLQNEMKLDMSLPGDAQIMP